MVRRLGQWIVVVIISVIAMTVLGGQARAIDGESIVMSPTSRQLNLDAGDSISGTFKIINDGTKAYDFKVYAAPYSVRSGNYNADFSATPAGADVYTWVGFEKKQYHLEPGQNIDVPYRIVVPSDASPGGHYGVVFAETQPKQDNQSNVVANKRVGMILYTAINGDYVQAGREVETTIPSFKLGGIPSASMTVENTGNVHFTSKETLRVKNVFGEKVYEKSYEHVILPKTTRDLALQWENGADLGWYNVETTSEILGKKVDHKGLVLVMPLWFVLVSVLVAFGIGYMIYRRLRR